MHSNWITPDFIEVGVNGECTAYAGVGRATTDLEGSKAPAVDTTASPLAWSRGQVVEMPRTADCTASCDSLR